MTYSQTLANNILDTLKKTLTDKGIRYQTLAEAMGVSIATVKRMMNKPSLPFDTLLEICHLVGLSFEELLDRTQDAQSRRAVFTQEQDEAFHKEHSRFARQQARQAMSVLGDYLVENMHKSNNYMALCQLHLDESEAMALIERMKEYWHQELKLNRPAIGQREGSKTYTMSLQLADCGYQSFDDLIPNIDN